MTKESSLNLMDVSS
uniref:Uncharacterized protein n=1 Tax=Rhizophora mucronata TaxID=61149 RepID=A0A2P2QPX1_RHIMU